MRPQLQLAIYCHRSPLPAFNSPHAVKLSKLGSSMSLTTQVFGRPISGRDRVYYKITEDQKLSDTLATNKTNPVVLMFWADWNIPCKAMMDPFRDMAWAKKEAAIFCLVDVDKCEDIVGQYKVEALPTFLLIKEGVEKARVVGPKVEELNTIINANIGGSSIPPAQPREDFDFDATNSPSSPAGRGTGLLPRAALWARNRLGNMFSLFRQNQQSS